jgi:hypothetical protein
MNKKVLSSLVMIADVLDNMGFYKEAKVLDRIVVSQNIETFYSKHIKKYKEYVLNKDVKGASKYYNFVMSQLPPDQQSTFSDQAMRIRLENNFGEYANKNNYRPIPPDYLSNFITKFGLNNSNLTKNQFDTQWNQMMYSLNNYYFNSDNTRIVDNPGFQRQLQLTYNLLSKKYNNR